MDPKVAVVIAVYNEARILSSVLKEMPKNVDVIIVDDGSKDETAEIALAFGTKVLKHAINLGQGVALTTGFRAALLEDYDILIEMDGDGQHNPHDIPRFITALQETEADIVVGSRRLGSSYEGEPFFRRTFLPSLTQVVNLFSGYSLTDSMCGFRAFRTPSLRRCTSVLFETIGRQYVAAEWFIKFSKTGLRVVEIPIDLQRRQHGTSYKGLIRYGWGVVRSILSGVAWR